MSILKVKQNTVLKTSPVQSSELSDTDKTNIKEGEYEIQEATDEGNHLLVTFKTPIAGKAQWYVFEDFVEFAALPPKPGGENTDAFEEALPDTSQNKGILLRLPGKEVHLLESAIDGGHFSWAEITKNGTRIPVNPQIVQNAIAMAHKLEDVREFFGGKTISITSWYRDPRTNKAIGGARLSKHLEGHGVDFNVAGLTPRQVQQQLESYWKGGMGYGKTFTHLDNRNYKARWNYGS